MTLKRQVQPAGFTLVELLVVIAIIGVIAGLLMSGVFAAKKKVINGRIAIDLSQVAQAMDTYKIDHEAYPPNSTDINELRRFIQRTWPKIDNTELASVSTLLNTYLDPAEAVPFWLGGFSSNPKFPFTGPGGPLVFDGTNFFANPERNKGTFQLDVTRLTLGPRQLVTAGPPTDIYGQLSTEEAPAAGDSFPVYIGYGSKMPLVYFHHTSYGNPLVQYPAVPTPETGVAKPYLSEPHRSQLAFQLRVAERGHVPVDQCRPGQQLWQRGAALSDLPGRDQLRAGSGRW